MPRYALHKVLLGFIDTRSEALAQCVPSLPVTPDRRQPGLCVLVPAACCCPSSGFSCWGRTGDVAGLITSMAPPPGLSYRLDTVQTAQTAVTPMQQGSADALLVWRSTLTAAGGVGALGASLP